VSKKLFVRLAGRHSRISTAGNQDLYSSLLVSHPRTYTLKKFTTSCAGQNNETEEKDKGEERKGKTMLKKEEYGEEGDKTDLL
jgi:hypothetical protein